MHTLASSLPGGGCLSQQDPNNPFCALITDMSNAFNELNRDALFQMLLITPNEQGPWMPDLPAGERLQVPECLVVLSLRGQIWQNNNGSILQARQHLC